MTHDHDRDPEVEDVLGNAAAGAPDPEVENAPEVETQDPDATEPSDPNGGDDAEVEETESDGAQRRDDGQ